MSNTQTKTKKMHVASVTLTNNNESNEKQMLEKKNGKVQTLWKNLMSRFTPAGWAHKALDDIHVYMHTRMCEHQYWFSIICFFWSQG